MSFIDNIKSEIDDASARYDLMNDKIMLFESVAYNDFIIRQKEIELDSYKYDYFGEAKNDEIEEVSASFKEKIQTAFTKIIENLKEFLEKIKEKIISLFEKIRESSLVTKIEELIKKNPKVANIKVEVKDNSKKTKLLEKEFDGAKKLFSRIKSGRVSEDDKDEIEERNNRVAKIAAVAGATIVITVGAVLASMKLFKKNASQASTDDTNLPPRLPSSAPVLLLDAGASVANVKKELSSDTVVTMTEYMDALKTGMSEAQKLDPDGSKLKAVLNNTIQVPPTGKPLPRTDKIDALESTQNTFDADNYFSELCNDIFGEDDSSDDFDKMYSELYDDIFF